MPSSRAERSRRPRSPRSAPRDVWRCIWTTVQACFRYRVLGLAAETAFYALLSLPPLLFGLAGAVGFIAKRIDITSVNAIRDGIIGAASRVLTPDAIDNVLTPTLNDVLSNGRADVISIGFVLALWSGSRAIAVFVDTCTIMYGMRGKRGMVTSRALALGIYIIFLFSGTLVLPLVLIGPDVVLAILPHPLQFLANLYWPVVGLASVVLLGVLYHVARPIRGHWYSDLPGALLTFAMWVLGSWILRVFLTATLGGVSLYGPLAAPIAVLMWLYLAALSVLIGAAFNASILSVWPEVAGLTQAERERLFDHGTPNDALSAAVRLDP